MTQTNLDTSINHISLYTEDFNRTLSQTIFKRGIYLYSHYRSFYELLNTILIACTEK